MTNRPILIAGPTASGKSALALALAQRLGRPVVNADALQVYGCWRILTARPSPEDAARAPHLLYGHVGPTESYSAGDWLRQVRPLLPRAPVIVGGTGLYFAALTEGLAEIPATPPDIRAEGDALRRAHGTQAFHAYLARHDPLLLTRIDTANPMRLQRGWEVHRATGRPLSDWQDATPPPDLPLADALPIRLDAPVGWLEARIRRRFDAMLDAGALEEARAARAWWRPDLPAARALGAAELMQVLDGRLTRAEAARAGALATRRYAKRQRTWARARMRAWHGMDPAAQAAESLVSRVISML